MLLAAVAVLLVPAAAAAAPPRALTPAGDVSVRVDHPKTNYGRAKTMRVATRPRAVAYLRFRLPRLGAYAVGRAVLSVYVERGARAGLEVRPAAARWSERRLTWRRRARVGRVLGRTRAPRRGRWVTVDVTPAVRDSGLVAFEIGAPRGGLRSLAASNSRHPPVLHLRTFVDRQPRAPRLTGLYVPWLATPVTRYHPLNGAWKAQTASSASAQISTMRWAGFDAGAAWWDEPGGPADRRFAALLAATRRAQSPLRWALWPQVEAIADPTAAQLTPVLDALDRRYGRDPAYLRVDRRPVLFVALGPTDGCDAAARWDQAAGGRFLLVMQTFAGHELCGAQPDAWFDPAPRRGASRLRGSYTVSPGRFGAVDAAPALPRDLLRFRTQVRAMTRSRAPWQIVSSLNDWTAGTAVEAATEWRSRSGRGQYLDILRRGGRPPATSAAPPRIAAAGDIACAPTDALYNNGRGDDWNCAQARTAAVVASLGVQAVLTLGDTQYEAGELANFRAVFGRTWGRFRSIIHPVVGNHEYADGSSTAADYFTYFNGPGKANGPAGPTGRGWYSYDLGSWHIVALNSMCWIPAVGGCGSNSPQVRWLRADLKAHPSACVLAYWHHPLFNSGLVGPTTRERPLWTELYRAGAEIVLNGHDHDYERFLPQSPSGVADSSGGIREWVVGTGGKTLLPWRTPRPNSVVRSASSFGVLELTLRPDSYTWRFVSAGPKRFVDEGTGDCH